MIAAALLLACLAQDAAPRRVADLPRAESGRWDGWESGLPADIETTYREAAEAYGLGDLVPAEARLFGILQAAPDHPAALHLYGVVEYALGRNGEAIAAFERFLFHAPEHVGRTRHFGHCLYGLGRYEDALAHYQRVLSAKPDDEQARRGLGLAHLRLQHHAAAFEALHAVLEVRPGDADASYWIAFGRFDEGEDLERALEEARRAEILDPHEPRVPFLVARIAAELGEDEVAAAARLRFEVREEVEARARPLANRLRYEPRRLDLWRALVELRVSAGDPAAARDAARRMARMARLVGNAEQLEWAREISERR